MTRLAHVAHSTPWPELPGALARARESGFDGVEINIGEGCTCDLAQSEESCRALAEAAHRLGARAGAACLADDANARIGAGQEDRRLQGRERVRTAARICDWLGVRVLRFVSAAPETPADPGRWSYQNALNETYRSLRLLRGDFERAGVVGAVEAGRCRFLLSPPEMRELLDRVNSPWVGAALDWGACQAHGDPRDWAETLQYWLRAVVVDESTAEEVQAALGQTEFKDAMIVAPGAAPGDGPDSE